MPVYSAAYAGPLGDDVVDRWDTYTWDVIRRRARFDELMATSFRGPERHYFVDLSPGGSFVALLRHGYGPDYRAASALDRFTPPATSMRRLREGLRAVLSGSASGSRDSTVIRADGSRGG
ncbi:hypothetical protein ABZS79_17205 [Streptomyces griseoloalbus]|uniref:hypothetical protein n=1 Tax=Streptomyces griseoloalbus TaxID=67303 RepID=UPI0033B96A5B